MKPPKTRRIRKNLIEFFNNNPLTDVEKSFILGCIKAQNKYPQLTLNQWEIVLSIKGRYKNGKTTSETPT